MSYTALVIVTQHLLVIILCITRKGSSRMTLLLRLNFSIKDTKKYSHLCLNSKFSYAVNFSNDKPTISFAKMGKKRNYFRATKASLHYIRSVWCHWNRAVPPLSTLTLWIPAATSLSVCYFSNIFGKTVRDTEIKQWRQVYFLKGELVSYQSVSIYYTCWLSSLYTWHDLHRSCVTTNWTSSFMRTVLLGICSTSNGYCRDIF